MLFLVMMWIMDQRVLKQPIANVVFSSLWHLTQSIWNARALDVRDVRTVSCLCTMILQGHIPVDKPYKSKSLMEHPLSAHQPFHGPSAITNDHSQWPPSTSPTHLEWICALYLQPWMNDTGEQNQVIGYI